MLRIRLAQNETLHLLQLSERVAERDCDWCSSWQPCVCRCCTPIYEKAWTF